MKTTGKTYLARHNKEQRLKVHFILWVLVSLLVKKLTNKLT
jgi:hypothetical protein